MHVLRIKFQNVLGKERKKGLNFLKPLIFLVAGTGLTRDARWTKMGGSFTKKPSLALQGAVLLFSPKFSLA
jgi:hypothetical protein